MADRSFDRVDHYKEMILRHINDNPELFLAFDTPSERRRETVVVPMRQSATPGGRIGPRPEPSETERAFNAGLYDSFTFGLGDEIGAGWESLGAMFDDRAMGDVYDTELGRLRAEDEYLREQHPLAYGGGSIVGAVVNPVSYVPLGWAARGAAIASYAGRMAKLGQSMLTASRAGAIDGAVYGFNSGEGGLESRLAGAAEGAGIGAVAGGVLPAAGAGIAAVGNTATQGLAHLINTAIDEPTKRIIAQVARSPQEAAALLERAMLMRRQHVNEPKLDLPETVGTAYDLGLKNGDRLNREMQVMHQGLFGTGFDTSKVALTENRMNRVGTAYVGPGYKASPSQYRLESSDRMLRYRKPSEKAEVYGTGKPGRQANLERDRRRKKYKHNLHINILD